MPTTPSNQDQQALAPPLSIGVLGYAFMGRAHTHALKTIPYMTWPPPAVPVLRTICGRNERAVREAAVRYGYQSYCTDWHDLVGDPEIQIFDNVGPNDLHAEPCIEAARQGKAIVCEKPLGRSAEEAKRMLDAVNEAGVTHMVAHNYRFVPALILARDLIQEGRLGEIYHFRGTYLQSSRADPSAPMSWRFRSEVAGFGALGDLGSHTIDLARWLVGEIGTVSALTKTFLPERPSGRDDGDMETVTVDDAVISLLEFQNGAIGTLEASRFAVGRKNYHAIEINGSRGALFFNLERLNELQFFSKDDPPELQGFRTILVTEPTHPYYRFWWPRGHIIGWEHTFIHELYHFLKAVAQGDSVAPQGATFLDGYRNAVVADGMAESARRNKKVHLDYAA